MPPASPRPASRRPRRRRSCSACGYALRGLVPAVPFLVILAVLQLVFYGRNYDPASPVIFQWGWIVVTAAVGRLVVVSAARFVELLMVTSVFTLSTRTTELTL